MSSHILRSLARPPARPAEPRSWSRALRPRGARPSSPERPGLRRRAARALAALFSGAAFAAPAQAREPPPTLVETPPPGFEEPVTPASPTGSEAPAGSEAPPASTASLAGKWRAEPMTVRWVIGSWGTACGPRPTGGGDAGGEVTIEERGGELVIQGDGGRFSTEQCWQMHPALSRQSHTRAANTWKTTCRSGPKDARQEILQTTVSVSGDVISLHESGQYQFTVQGQTCAASSGRWRTYRRLVEAPAPAPPPPPRAPSPCADPGPPARVEVRPSRKLMRAGESFHFRASVFDAQGCSLGTPVAWAVSPESPDVSIDGGRLTVARGAADAELSVTATAARQAVRVAVDIVSEERYAALLASGDFDAEGASSEAATATITAGSLGARDGAGGDGASDRKWTFVGLVSAIALVFALIGLWLFRRARRRPSRPAPRGRPLPDTGTVVFTGDDALGDAPRRLEATRLEAEAAAPPKPKPTTVCPVCGTMYDTHGARVCPKDGAQLLPINA